MFRAIAQDAAYDKYRHAVGPVIEISMKYRDDAGQYERRYIVRANFFAGIDIASGDIGGEEVPLEHRWSGNYRGASKLSVERDLRR